jgi:phospholipase C
MNLSSEGVSRKKRRLLIVGGLALVVAAAVFGMTGAFANSSSAPEEAVATTTPIKHVVVIFQENESFDHYFGTYPNAANGPGEPAFTAAANTPTVNGLSPALLGANPNADNPRRLQRSEAATCDMDHGYSDEQKAFDNGLMDRFVEFTAGGGCKDRSLVMDYFDGNTVTGLWNLAQHFSLSDNSYGTTFGPSTPGAINLISGETHGAEPANDGGVSENGTDIGDADPFYDQCGGKVLKMTGRNVGDLLNEKGITWGWFQGGFAPTGETAGKAVCGTKHKNIGGAEVVDYSPHHNPFEYWASTANPKHLAPESEAMIGHSEPTQPEGGANHEYDTTAFDEAVKHENLPAVSFVKAPEYQDGHPGYSDPLDEQTFIAEKINELEKSGQWESTAVVIAYDDSDGWYDHVMPPIVNPSESVSDALTGPGQCGEFAKSKNGINSHCGYGPRLPLLVISPYAKQNYVDNTVTDQSSITKFVEDNWGLGTISSTSMDNVAGSLTGMFDFSAPKAPKVFLDPSTGEVTSIEGPPGPAGGGNGNGNGNGNSGGSKGNGNPSTPPAPHYRVNCSVAAKDTKASVSCSVSGSGKGSVRFRIQRGKRTLGTSRAVIKGGRAKATIKTKQPLSGRYTLLVTVDRPEGVDAVSLGVSVPTGGKGHEKH